MSDLTDHVEDSFDYGDNAGNENNLDGFDSSFDVDNDWKPTPLAVAGNYYGTIKDVKLINKSASVVFTIVLNGNDEVYCTDGETPVDGIEVQSRLWLPKANDKNEMNSRGTMTKYQSKVNMMKSFAERTKMKINTFKDIMDAIEEQEWIGYPVVAKVTVETWEGRQFNRCDQFSYDGRED